MLLTEIPRIFNTTVYDEGFHTLRRFYRWKQRWGTHANPMPSSPSRGRRTDMRDALYIMRYSELLEALCFRGFLVLFEAFWWQSQTRLAFPVQLSPLLLPVWSERQSTSEIKLLSFPLQLEMVVLQYFKLRSSSWDGYMSPSFVAVTVARSARFHLMRQHRKCSCWRRYL